MLEFGSLLTNEHIMMTNNSATDDDNSPDHRRIMIINDNEDTNFSIKTVLEEVELKGESGAKVTHKIRVYPFPNHALEDFNAELYDLVLIDIVMPNINGFELYHRIRNQDNRVKLCFLTASDLPEEIKREMFPDEYEKICFMPSFFVYLLTLKSLTPKHHSNLTYELIV